MSIKKAIGVFIIIVLVVSFGVYTSIAFGAWWMGILFYLALAAFMGLLRFIEWLFED